MSTFLLIFLSLFQELWIAKFQESIENYESIQLKDMLKCTPLYSSSLSLRRYSSIQPNPYVSQGASDVKSTHDGIQLGRHGENHGVIMEDHQSEPEMAAISNTRGSIPSPDIRIV